MDYPSNPDVGLVLGKFTDGDPVGGVPASLDPASWANAVTDELLEVINQAGLTPDEGDNTQLYQAISALISASSYPLASQAEAEAGLINTNIMTPLRVAQAIAVLGISSGCVAYFARSTAPTGWLKANGANVSRTTYSALFAAIGTTFGAGDGSTTFTLPDLRGEFIRGWDDGRGVDTGRGFGSTQAMSTAAPGNGTYKFIRGATDASSTTSGTGDVSATEPALFNAGGGAPLSAGDAETRPRNIALLACIKY